MLKVMLKSGILQNGMKLSDVESKRVEIFEYFVKYVFGAVVFSCAH